MSIIDTIKSWFGIVSDVKVTTPRECLSAFILSLDKCDKNEDGMINVIELLNLYKNMTINSVVSPVMTNDMIKIWIDEFLKRE